MGGGRTEQIPLSTGVACAAVAALRSATVAAFQAAPQPGWILVVLEREGVGGAF